MKRLIELDKAIRGGAYPNCTSFAKSWGASRKTIQRDITFLMDRHEAPLEYDSTRRGYYYTDATWKMPTIDLSEGELFHLLIAGRMARQYSGTPMAEILESLFMKISEALPGHVTVVPSIVDNGFSFYGQPFRKIQEKTWLDIIRSIRNRRVLRISYRNSKSNLSDRREIEPIHLVCMMDEWYLIAYCRLRQELRHFSLARILSVHTLDESFPVRPFDPDAYFENRFGRFIGQPGKFQWVAVRFSKQAEPWILEKTWHPKQTIKKHAGGGLTLTFPIPDQALIGVKKWILQWGKDAQVVYPKDLKEDVAKEVMVMAGRYSNKTKRGENAKRIMQV